MEDGAAHSGSGLQSTSSADDASNVPGSINVDATNAPGSISVDATNAPGSISVNATNVPGSISVDATNAPEFISVDATNAPGSISVDTSNAPGSISVDASDVPGPPTGSGIAAPGTLEAALPACSSGGSGADQLDNATCRPGSPCLSSLTKTHAWQWSREHVLLPALRTKLIPLCHMATDGCVLQIANLHDLYKVFERC